MEMFHLFISRILRIFFHARQNNWVLLTTSILDTLGHSWSSRQFLYSRRMDGKTWGAQYWQFLYHLLDGRSFIAFTLTRFAKRKSFQSRIHKESSLLIPKQFCTLKRMCSSHGWLQFSSACSYLSGQSINQSTMEKC